MRAPRVPTATDSATLREDAGHVTFGPLSTGTQGVASMDFEMTSWRPATSLHDLRCDRRWPRHRHRTRREQAHAPTTCWLMLRTRYARGPAPAHAMRRSRLAVEGAQSDGSSCEQRRPPGHQSCACRCGGAWAGAAHERGTMAACRDALPRRAQVLRTGLKGREVRGRTDGTLSSRAQRPVHSRRHAWWTAYTE